MESRRNSKKFIGNFSSADPIARTAASASGIDRLSLSAQTVTTVGFANLTSCRSMHNQCCIPNFSQMWRSALSNELFCDSQEKNKN